MKKQKITMILMILLISGISFSQTGIIINTDAKLGIYGDAVIKIYDGDFANYSDQNELGGSIIFIGSSNQSIFGLVECSVIELNNSGGLSSWGDIRINDELILTQGVFDIQEHVLTLSENCEILGTFNSGNMIVGDGFGYLAKEINNTGTYFFPVGDIFSGADYSPVEITFNSGTFNNGSIRLIVEDYKHSQNSSSENYLTRCWLITSPGITGFNSDLEFTYVADDIVGNEANIYGGLWNGSNWLQLDQASALQFTGSVNEFGVFTGGEEALFSDISNLERDQFLLTYSNGTIFIFSPKDIHLSHAELYNSIGQLINVFDLNGQGVNEIHYTGSPGYYLVNIYTDTSYITKKIIIN